MKPTEREYNQSLDKWHKGIFYPYNINEDGFPKISIDSNIGSSIIKNNNKYEHLYENKTFKSDLYIKNNNQANNEYLEYMIEINLLKIEKYLKKRKKEIIQEEKLKKEMQLIYETKRRRDAKVVRHNITEKILNAKFNNIQNKHMKIKKLNLKKNENTIEQGVSNELAVSGRYLY